LLNQGDFAGAAAAVVEVPEDFLYETEHATTPAALHNGLSEASINGNFGVFDQERGNGLDFVSAEDLRVQGDSGVGTDGITESWFPSKYPNLDSPVTTADSGHHGRLSEAQLIVAESELQANAFGPMTDRLNALRDIAGLDPLSTPGNFTDATDLLFRERAFWLFATGHRLGDLRRLIRQYGRDPEAVFPTGDYFKAGLT
jgi:hypothetical protein